MKSRKINLGAANRRRIHVGFNSRKPVLIFLSSKFDLPSIARKWGEESFLKNGNYDEDTYVVLEVENLNRNCFKTLFNSFFLYLTDDSLLEFYWKMLNLDHFGSGAVNSILNGKPFMAGIEGEPEMERVKSYFGGPRFLSNGEAFTQIPIKYPKNVG